MPQRSSTPLEAKGGAGVFPEGVSLMYFALRGKASPRPTATYAYLSVAYITAFIVCMRFSASSKTRERGPSKTSLAASISGRPNFS